MELLILFMFVLAVFPTGLALGKFLDGRDIRKLGSGNIGGTNVARVYGWFWGIFVMVLDALKAGLIVSLLESFGPFKDMETTHLFLAQACLGALVILLNIFNPFLGFKGGKGVATGVGVALELDWQIAVLALGAFIIMLALHKFKRNDLFKASITGTCAAFVCSLFLHRPLPEIILFALAIPITLFTHRKNIREYIFTKKPLN